MLENLRGVKLLPLGMVRRRRIEIERKNGTLYGQAAGDGGMKIAKQDAVNLADRKQVQQLNGLLAQLTGRKIEEFEQTVQMEKLIEIRGHEKRGQVDS